MLTPVEYQIKKSRIPFYSQHEAGWYLCKRESSQPVADLDFVEFRRPYFIFKVKLLTENKEIADVVFKPISMDPYELSRRFILHNRKGDQTIDMKDFLTSGIGNDEVTLSDRRPWKDPSPPHSVNRAIRTVTISVMSAIRRIGRRKR